MLTGNVGAKIRGINQTIAQLPQYFCFHRAILLSCKKTATDAALVRNDNEFKSLRFQTPQRFWDAAENPYLLRVGTIISILHDRAIAIDKNRWRSCLGGRGHLSERDVVALLQANAVVSSAAERGLLLSSDKIERFLDCARIDRAK